MAVTINASSANGLQMTSDLSGQLQFQNNGVNLPMGGVAPAFSAYQSSSQSIANVTVTKVQYQTELFDTNNNFDSVTNYRFTPTVAGYYQINAAVSLAPTIGANGSYIMIYKNGSEYQRGNLVGVVTGVGILATISSIVNFNGSSDYIEIYVYQNTGASAPTNNFINLTYFNGCLVRGA